MPEDYHDLFETSPLGICIIQDGLVQQANPTILCLLGYTLAELKCLQPNQLLYSSSFIRVIRNELKRLSGLTVPSRYEFTAMRRTRSLIKLLGFFSLSSWNSRPAILMQVYDLEAKGPMEIHNDEAKYKEILNSLNEVIFELNTQGKIIFANNRAYDFFGVTDDDYLSGVYAADYVVAADRLRLVQNMQQLLQGEKTASSEFLIQKKDGTTIPAIVRSTRIIRHGKVVGLSGVIIDITERKLMENRIILLSERDVLTGLYNRLSFQNALLKLTKYHNPLSITICDVDGLKLTNDTMGHTCGDQLIVAAAQILQEVFAMASSLPGVGGDEFAIILTNTSRDKVKELIKNIQDAIIALNQNATGRIPLSLSCGYATSETGAIDSERILNEADHHMYKEKLFHSQSNRNTVIQTLLKSLKMRDYIIDGHVERLQQLVLQLATRAGIATQKSDDLRLFAQFHDIGKVGVPDRILFKQNPFTKEERMEMQRHSEIGYRIAQSAPDLVHISDWILKHHEWWNGNGYPLGLKGTEIPLECRILSIIDAFDAMTHDRPYRKAITPIEAIAEIQRYSDIQFDPWLVGEFIQMIKQPVSDKLFQILSIHNRKIE